MAQRNAHPPLTWRYLVLSFFVGLFAFAVLFVSLRSPNSLTRKATELQGERPLTKLLEGKIVPGHPLYLFYMARDRCRLLIERRPQEKYALLVEYARIRLLSAQELIRGGETQLGISTLAKAEAYLGSAVEVLMKLTAEQGKDRNHVNQLFTALTIHEQYMLDIHDTLSDTEKTGIDQLLTYNRSLQKTLFSVVPDSF